MSVHNFPHGGERGEEPPGKSGDGGGNFGERLAAVETHVQYLATKEDIAQVKVWILSGVIGGAVIATGLAIAVIRIFAS